MFPKSFTGLKNMTLPENKIPLTLKQVLERLEKKYKQGGDEISMINNFESTDYDQLDAQVREIWEKTHVTHKP